MSNIKESWKEKILYTTACLAFVSGLALTWLQYLLQGEISNGVLGFVALTLVYSASIYGVSIYIQGKFGELKNYLLEKEYVSSNNDYKERDVVDKEQYKNAG